MIALILTWVKKMRIEPIYSDNPDELVRLTLSEEETCIIIAALDSHLESLTDIIDEYSEKGEDVSKEIAERADVQQLRDNLKEYYQFLMSFCETGINERLKHNQ